MNPCRAFLLLVLAALPRLAPAQTADTARASLARTSAFALTQVLDPRPGAFVYRFDAHGWPEALSLDGLPPTLTPFHLGTLPFDDLLTGRARFDLVPLAWMDTLATDGAGVSARFRAFDAPRPRTEARYLSGPDGFQSIEAIHAQGRRRTLLGEKGVVRYVFGYTGRAADNEFDNSRLTRGRATLAQAGFEGTRTAMSLYNFHTRVKVGAPGGVVPVDPADPSSIYDRFNATVHDLTSARRTLRNDTGVRLRRRALRVHLYRSFERFAYVQRDTSFTARATRYGGYASLQAGTRAVELQAWTLGAGDASVTDGRQARAEAGVRDTLGALALYAGASYDGTLRPVGAARLRTAFVDARLDAQMLTLPLAAEGGFGPYARAARKKSSPLAVTASADVAGRRGAWRVGVRPFATFVLGGFDFIETTRDTLGVVARDLRRAGATLYGAWRGDATRGLYTHAQATANIDLSATRWRDLPPLTAEARLGLRASLFQNDLRLDLFARVQTWSGFDGRVLHDPTGLLVLAATPQRVPASSTLDVTALMNVRTATLFITRENAFSGTAVLRGNYLVPEQPLPAARTRFGVFWPIFD